MKTILVSFLICAAIEVTLAQGPKYALPIKYISSPMNCSDVKFIVDYHNSLRMSLVNGSVPGQPRAADMQTIVWDNDLMNVATDYSKQMVFAHNPNRTIDRFTFGENLFMIVTSNMKDFRTQWKNAIDGWFNEYKLFTYAPLTYNPAILHYTQLVWANSIYIGCGQTFFSDARNRLFKLFVCNYGPTGNWAADYPYKTPDMLNVDPSSTKLLCTENQCAKKYGSC